MSNGFCRSLPSWRLLSLLVTCRMDTAFGPASSAPAELPADKVLDVARSYEGAFEYETLLPVELNLTVELYRQPAVSGALERLAVADQLIVVTLEDSAGERLYAGSVPNGGTLSTVLALPAAPGSVVLRLESPGFEPREVTIDGMVLYSEVNRVMGLLTKGLSAKAVLPDADQDGVPDVYDVDPLDPEVAFEVRSPATGNFTVAFEDLYPVPGDADYNDFVANYWVLEKHKSVKPVEPIEIIEEIVEEVEKEKPLEIGLHVLQGEATATAKIAGYNHKFGIVIDFPGVTVPRVTREYYDAYGIRRMDTKTNVADKAVIWLFENTKYAVGKPAAKFEITFPDGITREMLSISPHDPVLYVLNTCKDIHLVGEDPLEGTAAVGGYMDSNGYPWALLVPDTWKHPAECQYIGKAYPLFDEWRSYKGAKAAYWYLYPASAGDVVGNNPPSKVSSSDSTQLVAGYKITQDFHLNSVDPDGGRRRLPEQPGAPGAEEPVRPGRREWRGHLPAPDSRGGLPVLLLERGRARGQHDRRAVESELRLPAAGHQQSAEGQLPGYAGTGPAKPLFRRRTDILFRTAHSTPSPSTIKPADPIRFSSSINNGSPKWGIDSVLPEPSTATVAFTAIPYYTVNAVLPPESTWTLGAATGDAPSVFRVPISGDPKVGSKLTGHYIFEDLDGDDEVGSHYQWYRFSNSTDTDTALATKVGGDSESYTPLAGDLNKWLRLQVTPVDEHGAVGTPSALSDAVQVIAES